MLTRPRVKFCGMTRGEDAIAAAEIGADAIGFVFWERSPRFITPDRARVIARDVPTFVARVGVFVDAERSHVESVMNYVGLDVVQLHGDELPEAFLGLQWPVIKALGRGGDGLMTASRAWPEPVTLLVDAHDADRRGGTGLRADWAAADALARERRVILAGGLTPENVGEAIAAVGPYAVDVASGVEDRPGVKNHARMRAFARAVEQVATLPVGRLRTE